MSEDILQVIVRRLDLLGEEIASLRRTMLDEFTALRHLVQALDRDIEGLSRYVAGQDGES